MLYSADMSENSGDITLNDEMVTKRLDHLDEGIHELQQQLDRIEGHLTTIAADVEAARPLLERWQHSKIRKLADGIGKGQMPWQGGPAGG